MNGRNVRIAKLRIRVPRAMAAQAAGFARGLGERLLRGLASGAVDGSSAGHIDALGPVRVRAGRALDIAELQEQVAERVTGQLRARGEGDSHG